VRCNRGGGAAINTCQLQNNTPKQLPISQCPIKSCYRDLGFRVINHNCHLGHGTADTILLCHVFLVASLVLLFLFIPSRFNTLALLDSDELTLTKLIRAHE